MLSSWCSRCTLFQEHYYHVPDFHRLPTAKHYAFIISVRDVYERTVSSFLYHHPKNAAINQVKLTRNHEQYGPIAYSCFDTLDDFAVQLHGASSPDQCDYPYPINVVTPVTVRPWLVQRCMAKLDSLSIYFSIFETYGTASCPRIHRD